VGDRCIGRVEGDRFDSGVVEAIVSVVEWGRLVEGYALQTPLIKQNLLARIDHDTID
jgi:hypothetical protein